MPIIGIAIRGQELSLEDEEGFASLTTDDLLIS